MQDWSKLQMPKTLKKLKEFKPYLENNFKEPQIVHDRMNDLIVNYVLITPKTNSRRRTLSKQLRDILKEESITNSKF